MVGYPPSTFCSNQCLPQVLMVVFILLLVSAPERRSSITTTHLAYNAQGRTETSLLYPCCFGCLFFWLKY